MSAPIIDAKKLKYGAAISFGGNHYALVAYNIESLLHIWPFVSDKPFDESKIADVTLTQRKEEE